MDFTDFDEKFVQDTITDIASANDTVPTPVVKPPFQQPNEEELHTSFEEAIGDRLIALMLLLSGFDLMGVLVLHMH